MKTLAPPVQVTEVPGEGLFALLGQRVLIMCGCYFYHGTLTGINDTFVKLEDAAIVYETGAWSAARLTDAQPLGTEPHYVMIQVIESFRKDARR